MSHEDPESIDRKQSQDRSFRWLSEYVEVIGDFFCAKRALKGFRPSSGQVAGESSTVPQAAAGIERARFSAQWISSRRPSLCSTNAVQLSTQSPSLQ